MKAVMISVLSVAMACGGEIHETEEQPYRAMSTDADPAPEAAPPPVRVLVTPPDQEGGVLLRPVLFRIENRYEEESTFWLQVEVEVEGETSEGTVMAFDGVAIAENESRTSDVEVVVPVGARIHPALIGRSLGENRLFRDLVDSGDGVAGVKVGPETSVLRFVYGYSATDGFGVTHGWE